MRCGCDPTRGGSCRRCDGTDAEGDVRVSAYEMVRDHGDGDDEWRIRSALDAYEKLLGARS